jgi:hypothetical protein
VVSGPRNDTGATSKDNVIDTLRQQQSMQEATQQLEQLGIDLHSVSSAVSTGGGATPAPANPQDLQDNRDGLTLYTDSDGDGVSDYDEIHIYHTDPHNAHSSGSSLTDGQRILLGLDVHSTSNVRVPVEAPQDSNAVTRSIFEVNDIHAEKIPTPLSTSTPARANASAGTPAVPQEAIVFSGKGLPNSFVTLYIYSTPVVVTVKADENGNWKYTLDSELPDGQHDLYVAMVDNDGKIIARSPAVPFTKQAEALDYVPLVVPPVTEPTLIDTLRDNMLVLGGILLLIFGGIVVSYLGIRHPAQPL